MRITGPHLDEDECIQSEKRKLIGGGQFGINKHAREDFFLDFTAKCCPGTGMETYETRWVFLQLIQSSFEDKMWF